MLTVFKFDVEIRGRFEVVMPIGSKFLSLQLQKGIPRMWWLVNANGDREVRRFYIVGTGNPVDYLDDKEYLGTVQHASFVWHLFTDR